jgi:hypothetical protein
VYALFERKKLRSETSAVMGQGDGKIRNSNIETRNKYK